ncbi:MAG TPA: hypothetical protein PLX69_10900 [Leptospiraceae bacterium]|nr:hypothetical protein [Leptospiraceae bacterium]HRG75056.1 hypothetical protein [Leptospiraceae bacterium]
MKTFRVMIAGFIFCLFFTESCSSVIQGEIIARGNPTGDFILNPTGCYSGARMQFYGIILTQAENKGLVLTGIIDPIRGKLIKLRLPDSCQSDDYDDCKEIFISKESCSVYKIKIEPTNVMVNKVRALRGKLELDCKFQEGGSIKGKIEFDYCH